MWRCKLSSLSAGLLVSGLMVANSVLDSVLSNNRFSGPQRHPVWCQACYSQDRLIPKKNGVQIECLPNSNVANIVRVVGGIRGVNGVMFPGLLL